MAKPSDREFQLKRKIKELEEQNARMEIEIVKLKKQIDKLDKKDLTVVKKPAKVVNKSCPDCGADIKTTDLPHAVMDLCSAACGFRSVQIRNKK